MCFFHEVQNNKTYVQSITAVGKCGHPKSDMVTLQHCQDKSTLKKASALFLEKWRKDKGIRVKDFLQFFKEQWLQKYLHWYEGAAPKFLSINNGLETTNLWIKQSHTLRKRLPGGQFVTSALSLVEKWSEC